ncbi:hypothetical protein JCM24511_07784 [Saitozyma sp. JCM 24511]|nr:hypothetical protein JCM24511_07784 [Saitozyma sp. JCM 24511]
MGSSWSSAAIKPAPNGYLSVEGTQITLNGKPFVLKGAALGGWMNMENFITGYTGHEHQLREAMLDVLGKDKYEFFFDKFLTYFFGEDDAKLFASLGLNCLRLPVNYRHFEDDMNPRVFKKEGLKHLDRVVDLHQADLDQVYDHKDFQDRTVKVWEHLAAHYKDNTWVAGYNPINEPTDRKYHRLNAFYDRIEKAIRASASQEPFEDISELTLYSGKKSTFAWDFSHFPKPLPNCVYACHDYSPQGTPEQIKEHEKMYAEKTEYMTTNKAGVFASWVCSPLVDMDSARYGNAEDGIPNWEEINKDRFAMLETQLDIYAKVKASWSIWLYKDIGFQGMTYVGEDTPYIKLLKPFLLKKKRLVPDAWGVDDIPVRALFEPLEKWLEENVPSIVDRYPQQYGTKLWLQRVVRETLLSEEMVKEYAGYFRGKGYDELDELAKSFSLVRETICREKSS